MNRFNSTVEDVLEESRELRLENRLLDVIGRNMGELCLLREKGSSSVEVERVGKLLRYHQAEVVWDTPHPHPPHYLPRGFDAYCRSLPLFPKEQPLEPKSFRFPVLVDPRDLGPDWPTVLGMRFPVRPKPTSNGHGVNNPRAGDAYWIFVEKGPEWSGISARSVREQSTYEGQRSLTPLEAWFFNRYFPTVYWSQAPVLTAVGKCCYLLSNNELRFVPNDYRLDSCVHPVTLIS